MQKPNVKVINFGDTYPETELFSGRKNGVRARKAFGVEESDIKSMDRIELKCSESQVITSSYFLGLLELYVRKYSSVDQVLQNISMDSLNDYCKTECIDALEYTFLDDSGVF